MMNSPMNKKKWFYCIVACALLVLTLFVLYANFVEPLSNELQSKENELKTEEQVLALLQENKQSGETMVESTVELQKQLPVQPHVQQLILDLNRAEIVSDSFIKTIGIAEEGTVEGQADEASAEGENADSVPDGIEKVTLSLSVQSLSYMDLEKFIASLESMQRIAVVDSIAFSGPEEITLVEQSSAPLDYTVSLSAFYAPGLEDLQGDLPRVNTTPPAKKKYPFYTSPDLQESNGDN